LSQARPEEIDPALQPRTTSGYAYETSRDGTPESGAGLRSRHFAETDNADGETPHHYSNRPVLLITMRISAADSRLPNIAGLAKTESVLRASGPNT